MAKSAGSSGIGLAGATFLVLLVLKLLNKITISWLWVTAPLWGGLAIAVAIGIGVLAVAGIMMAVAFVADTITRRRRRKF